MRTTNDVSGKEKHELEVERERLRVVSTTGRKWLPTKKSLRMRYIRFDKVVNSLPTFWDVNLMVGIPSSRWGAQPFVTHPFVYPANRAERMMDRSDSVDRISKCTKHMIHLALKWAWATGKRPRLDASANRCQTGSFASPGYADNGLVGSSFRRSG